MEEIRVNCVGRDKSEDDSLKGQNQSTIRIAEDAAMCCEMIDDGELE